MTPENQLTKFLPLSRAPSPATTQVPYAVGLTGMIPKRNWAPVNTCSRSLAEAETHEGARCLSEESAHIIH